MDLLKDQEAVMQMLRFMEENGRKEQAREISQLIACMDNMEQQYNAVLSELQEVKQQLAEIPEQRHPVKTALADMVQALEERAGELREQLQTIQENIVFYAQSAVSGFKQMGVSALDAAVDLLNIKSLLESVQDKICRSIETTSASIRRVEAVGQELRSAGNHLKNAGRAAAGKESRQADTEQGGRFQAAVLAPIRAVNTLYTNMNKAVYGAIRAVEQLEQTAEENRGKRQRPSVHQRLKQMKDKAASQPLPDKTRKPVQPVL